MKRGTDPNEKKAREAGLRAGRRARELNIRPDDLDHFLRGYWSVLPDPATRSLFFKTGYDAYHSARPDMAAQGDLGGKRP